MTYPPPKKKSHVGLWILLVVVVLVAGCGIIAFAITGAGVKAVNDAVNSASAAAGNGAGGGAPVTSQPLPAGQVGEGRLEVGKDIQPGTYKATVPADSVGCYWSRLKDLSGDPGSIITNGLGQPGAKLTVTIKASDKGFETQGCGIWTKV